MAAAVQQLQTNSNSAKNANSNNSDGEEEDERNNSPVKSPAPPPLHSLLPFRDEDLWSSDELKIFSDEGEEDDQAKVEIDDGEELREEKSSLIAETELGIKQESSSSTAAASGEVRRENARNSINVFPN